MIEGIFEDDGVFEYLQKRRLVQQYLKEKRFLLQGVKGGARFKKRQPKGSGLWYFRINQQYRAIGAFKDRMFYVSYIDAH